ncbi:MAG TPA: hypothetical protein VH021_14325, partial [Trebonia sp.]|nr:hypothetical protein [Trebonia sp.]
MVISSSVNEEMVSAVLPSVTAALEAVHVQKLESGSTPLEPVGASATHSALLSTQLEAERRGDGVAGRGGLADDLDVVSRVHLPLGELVRRSGYSTRSSCRSARPTPSCTRRCRPSVNYQWILINTLTFGYFYDHF